MVPLPEYSIPGQLSIILSGARATSSRRLAAERGLPGNARMDHLFHDATLILPDRIVEGAAVLVRDGRIDGVFEKPPRVRVGRIDLQGAYLAPGFIDLHVHGGSGADFMDATPDAFT